MLRLDLPKTAAPAIAEVRAQAEAFASSLGVGTEDLVLGGRSFGGRMCSMAVAQGLPAAGLVLLSYPLHPPGRPDTLRIAHLPDIRVPVLAVSGTTDPFGSPDELTHHLAAIPGPVTTVFLPGPHLPTSADRRRRRGARLADHDRLSSRLSAPRSADDPRPTYAPTVSTRRRASPGSSAASCSPSPPSRSSGCRASARPTVRAADDVPPTPGGPRPRRRPAARTAARRCT